VANTLVEKSEFEAQIKTQQNWQYLLSIASFVGFI
jgi:hypothetical protein